MEPPGRSRLPVDDGAGGGDQAPAVPAARTGGRGRGRAGRAGNRPRAAQGPGIVRKRCGHDLVGGDRVNEWPSGWFRDEKPKPAGGADGPGAARPEASEPTVGLPAGSAGAAPGAGGYARAAGGRGPRARARPEQPPMYGPPPSGQRGRAPATYPRTPPPPSRGGRGGGRTGRHRGRRILLITGSVVLVVAVLLGAMYFY